LRPLREVNRYAVTLLPTEDYLRWTMECPDADPHTTLEDLRDDPTVYLVPEIEGDMDRYLRRNYKRMLADELYAWCTDENYWPKDLSYRTFCKLFHVQLSSIVYDLASGPIDKDDRDDDE